MTDNINNSSTKIERFIRDINQDIRTDDLIVVERENSTTEVSKQVSDSVGNLVKAKSLEVRLDIETDVAEAYRAYYRDQIVNDKRNELGRFLFGVSFTTIGFIVSILKLSTPEIDLTGARNFQLLFGSGSLLLFSAMCALRLAIPKNQTVDPTTLELIELHRSNSNELSRLGLAWFIFWVVGLILGLLMLIT